MVVLTIPDPPPIRNGSNCLPTAAGVDIDLPTWNATFLSCAAMGNWTGLGHNSDFDDYVSILGSLKSVVDTGEAKDRIIRIDARGGRLSRPGMVLQLSRK